MYMYKLDPVELYKNLLLFLIKFGSFDSRLSRPSSVPDFMAVATYLGINIPRIDGILGVFCTITSMQVAL